MTSTPGLPSLRDADWLNTPATRAVFAALNRDGSSVRAVGGVVRNSLLGTHVHDVDLATTARPEETMRRAESAGLRAIPTGFDHGTVTVICEHTPYEVTTLRTDVETFGRHARVSFTEDWAADARRRDFTLNALYCDADGTVHDPLGGYPDLIAGRVRFIGDAHERIREDYLRILRFFRFSGEYADGQLDAAGLRACLDLRDGLDRLSRERVRSELLRLLVTPHAARVVPAIADDFLTRLLPTPPNVALFARLVALETALDLAPDPLRRLGALSAHPGCALQLREALRLSSGEFERLARLALPDRALEPDAMELEAQAFIYRYGATAFVDGVLMAWARSTLSVDDAGAAERIAMPDRWQPPVLPVRGVDIIKLGVPSGPIVGQVLTDFEEWWIANGFPSDAEQIAARVADLVRRATGGA